MKKAITIDTAIIACHINAAILLRKSICRQEICCISIGCIKDAGENGAAEK